jgi:LmbE family N-acetylglucosaminyl deacetylase
MIKFGGRTLFISPHFDDVALSCGGTVALQARSGRAIVVTVFAGEPPGELNSFARFQHDRWGTDSDTVDVRRAEDRAALEILGAESRLLTFRDAIYRGSLYLSDEDLFGPVKPEDAETANAVNSAILAMAKETRATRVFLPLGIGGHVDHRICHATGADLLAAGRGVYFYEDFPYVVTASAFNRRMAEFDPKLISEGVDISDVLDVRITAIGAYASQVPTIFRHYGPFAEVVRSYAGVPERSPIAYFERFWQVPTEWEIRRRMTG